MRSLRRPALSSFLVLLSALNGCQTVGRGPTLAEAEAFQRSIPSAGTAQPIRENFYRRHELKLDPKGKGYSVNGVAYPMDTLDPFFRAMGASDLADGLPKPSKYESTFRALAIVEAAVGALLVGATASDAGNNSNQGFGSPHGYFVFGIVCMVPLALDLVSRLFTPAIHPAVERAVTAYDLRLTSKLGLSAPPEPTGLQGPIK
jgi:hypothetical protein